VHFPFGERRHSPHRTAKKAFAINGENKFIPHCIFGLTIPRMEDSEADFPFHHGRLGRRP
jgi:hypothetical protein